MSFKIYLKYKLSKIKDTPKEFRRPTTWIDIYIGVFLFFMGLAFLRGEQVWLFVGGLFVVPLALTILLLDYKNTPWLKWHVEKIKEEEYERRNNSDRPQVRVENKQDN